jgi:hypothetical protein
MFFDNELVWIVLDAMSKSQDFVADCFFLKERFCAGCFSTMS